MGEGGGGNAPGGAGRLHQSGHVLFYQSGNRAGKTDFETCRHDIPAHNVLRVRKEVTKAVEDLWPFTWTEAEEDRGRAVAK